MAKRGRQSSASMEIASTVQVLGQRPPAPLSLNERATDEWNRVVNRMPSDWFTDETLTHLQMYCEHVAEGEALQIMIERVRPTAMVDDESYKRYRDLLRDKELQTRAVLSCATKMRMTHQSSYTDKASGTAKRDTTTMKPWDAS